ncbi:MAG: hypothetical protein LBQ54_10435, partial [Planctomycetaceae bacterium]|jgi:hypothetical protein|nr:hypothetical protein [Planctomycetaceae bacterium]
LTITHPHAKLASGGGQPYRVGSSHKVLRKVFIMLTLHNLLLPNGFKLDATATRRSDKKRFLSGDTKIKNVAGNTAWSLPQFVFDSRTA